MRICEQLAGGRPTLSFEFFPPKDDIGFWDLYKTIESLKPLEPTYVSVTYGAGGSTRGKTLEIVSRIRDEFELEAMAHFTCVGATVDELRTRAEFVEISSAGMRESHVHDVQIVKEAPNYRVE